MTADGDGWKVVLGDCRGVLADAPRPALVLCDPPYGVSLAQHSRELNTDGTVRKRRRATKIAGDDTAEVAEWVVAWADRHGYPLVVFASPHRPLPGEWRNVLVWDKGPAVGGGGDPATCWKRTVELIYTRRTGKLRGKRDEAVLRFHVNTGDDFRHHPCQKPIPLLRYLIRQLTDPGDVVLDPCMGSGSTGVACLAEGRSFLGVEVSADHYRTAVARIRRAAGVGSLFGQRL